MRAERERRKRGVADGRNRQGGRGVLMRLGSIIVATDGRDAIGRDGGLPWHLPDDLKRFKTLTMGKPIVMGRKTWDTIGRPLPGRHNIVMTRQAGFDVPGVTVVASLDDAMIVAGDVPEVCIIGGAEIYRPALPRTNPFHFCLL